MINIGKILKRAWHILWNYRILWVFGLLLALTTAGGGGSNGGSSSTRSTPDNLPRISENAPEWAHQISQWFAQNVQPLFARPEQHIGTFVMIAAIVFLVALLLGTLAAFVRYPAETAVMRMVAEYEQSGRKMGFRQGWKLGWTRRAFHLWLIDLILAIPALVFVLLILGAGLIAYYSVSATFQVTNPVGVVAAIGLACISVLCLIAVAVFLHLLRHFFARAAALEGMSVGAALQSGWAMFKRNWKSIGLMWLVMVAIGFGMGIAGMIALFVLIPAYLILLIPAGIVAALPALIAYGITSLFTGGPLLWIITTLIALPFFLVILFAPLFLFVGWYKLFESNVWTLTYREIKAMESAAAAEVVVVENEK